MAILTQVMAICKDVLLAFYTSSLAVHLSPGCWLLRRVLPLPPSAFLSANLAMATLEPMTGAKGELVDGCHGSSFKTLAHVFRRRSS